jgi:hypothetical protein
MPNRKRTPATIIVVLLVGTLAGGCHLSDRELAGKDAPAAEVPVPIVTGPPRDGPGSADGGTRIDAAGPIDAPTSDDAPAVDGPSTQSG